MTRPIVNPLPTPASSSDAGSSLVSKTDSILASLPPAADETNDVVDFLDAEQVRNQTNLTTTQQDTDQIEQDKLDVINAKGQSDEVLVDTLTNANTILAPMPTIESRTYALGNFKGEWSQLSGILPVDSTVKHQGGYWRSLVSIPAVSLSEPSEGNSDWELLENIGNVPIGLAGDLVKSFDDLTATGEYLECDGSTYLKSAYPELTEKIGSGSRTFLDGLSNLNPFLGFNQQVIAQYAQSHMQISTVQENYQGSYCLYAVMPFNDPNGIPPNGSARYCRVAKKENGRYVPVNDITSNRINDYGSVNPDFMRWLSETEFVIKLRNNNTLVYRRVTESNDVVVISGPNIVNTFAEVMPNVYSNRNVIRTSNSGVNTLNLVEVTNDEVTLLHSLTYSHGLFISGSYFYDQNSFLILSARLVGELVFQRYSIVDDQIVFEGEYRVTSPYITFNIAIDFRPQRSVARRNLNKPMIVNTLLGCMVFDLSNGLPVIQYEIDNAQIGVTSGVINQNEFHSGYGLAISTASQVSGTLVTKWLFEFVEGELKVSTLTLSNAVARLGSISFYLLDYGFASAVNASALGILPTHDQATEFRLPTISPIIPNNATSNGWTPKLLKTYIRTNTNTGI